MMLFFDGMQDLLTMRKPEWDVNSPFANINVGRDGSTNGSAGVNSVTTKYATFPTSAATCICGFGYLYANNNVLGYNSGGNYKGFACFTRVGQTASNSPDLVLTLNSEGRIEARKLSVTGTLIATGTTRLNISTWYFIEAKVVLDATSGSVEVRVNGVTEINATGVTFAGTGNVEALGFSGGGGGNGLTLWDDLWVCDGVDATSTQGRPYNDFLGDLKISTLLPSANGDSTQWTKSTGTNGAALTDEVPPNTTDYIFSSTTGQRELMAHGDLGATAGNVMGVRVGVYALKSDSGSGAGSNVKIGIKESGGTITMSANRALSTTAAAYWGDQYVTKPSASTTPFTASDVNALQAGVETG